jgi:hypothetical protein
MSEQPYHGSREALRDFIGECMGRAAFYANNAVNYAAVDDDAGLDYSTRCAVAALQQGASVLKMLKETNAKIAQEQMAARAEIEGADRALGL